MDHAAIVRQRLVALFASLAPVAVVGLAERARPARVARGGPRPDVVIRDSQMPDGDGLVVLEAAPRLEPAPAVMVRTNSAAAHHRRRCEAAAADFFLDKSNEFVEFPSILRRMIEQGGRTMADTQAAARTHGHRVPTDG